MLSQKSAVLWSFRAIIIILLVLLVVGLMLVYRLIDKFVPVICPNEADFLSLIQAIRPRPADYMLAFTAANIAVHSRPYTDDRKEMHLRPHSFSKPKLGSQLLTDSLNKSRTTWQHQNVLLSLLLPPDKSRVKNSAPN